MSKFFAPDEVYKKRIALCKKCDFYFKPTGSCKICGCFMKIKARISMMDCPNKYWGSFDFNNTKDKASSNIPVELITELKEIYPHFRTGKARDQKIKERMINLYNVIYNGHFDINTNCSSCLNKVWKSLEALYKEQDCCKNRINEI
jgi:hypothetical protein